MKVLTTLLLLTFAASAVHGEVARLELGAVPAHQSVAFDFGCPLPDIDRVEIAFAGLGGHQCIHINRPGQDETILYPFNVDIDLEAGVAVFYAPMDQAYAATQFALLPEGATWDSLADGTGTIKFSPYHTGPEVNDFQVTACGFDPFTVSSATIIVTFGEGVPVEPRSWSGLKAIFR